VTITQLSSTTLAAGQSASLQYQIQNNLVAGPQQVDISVNISNNNLSCSGACGSRETINDPGGQEFRATLRAANDLAPGSNQTVTISITAQNRDGNSQAARAQVTLRGPDAPQTAKSISGRVVNVANGKGIPDATVALNDAGGHNYSTQSDSDGDFKFTSTNDKPIAPGRILLGAGKEGFQSNQTSTDIAAGQAKTGLRITLRSTATPSASATVQSPTAEATTEDTTTGEPSTEESIDPAAAGNNQGSDSGGGLFSWVLIILGGLLVALGVGAIVLLVIRRKDNGEDDTGDPLPGPRGPRPTPGAQGVYRNGPAPTMVTGGAAMGGGPTMAMGPGMANAPTMMHKPVDEYGDPYGTPLRAPQPAGGLPPGATQPGYGYPGANQGGYGPGGSPAAPMGPGSPDAPTAYGSASPTGYGAPTGRAPAGASPPDPYAPRESRDYAPPGSPGGGYGYDEPTGRYDPDGGYGQASGGYGADRGGYGPGNSGGGYGSSNGYGQQDGGYGPNGGGYESEPRGGYEPDPGGGYGNGRYDSPPSGYGSQGANGYDEYGPQQGGYPSYDQGGGGYDRVPEQRSPGGYEQPREGYDQGYYDEPTKRGERGGRASRRSLDWLDD
jgi:hypothetical protein